MSFVCASGLYPTAAEGGNVPSLFVIRGNDQGVRFELETETVSVGREATNVVQLHDSEVSRHHAELRRQGKRFLIVDQGSSNGTFVNGQQVKQHELASGDQVQLGGTLMLYTGAAEDSHVDLAEKVDIIAAGPSSDRARIVRSMSQAEGSQILRQSDGPGTESPWLSRARSNLQVMYRTALAVSHTLDIDQLLNRILQLIFEWVEADRGCIMLVRDDGKGLEPKVHLGRKGVEERIAISQTILDFVMSRGEGVLTSNAKEDQRWDPAASIVQMGVREAICVPMQGRYDVVGVIYIDTNSSQARLMQLGGNKFNEEHLKLMIAIAHQAALAVEDTRHYSAMVQAERLAAMGQTIAMLSHHIKNIIQGIRGGSFLIQEGLRVHQETMIQKGWTIVEKNQEKISNLVMDMLTFSKDREPTLAPANMNRVAADVAELMQSRAEELGVKLVFQPAAEMPMLTFDDEGLHRAILNVTTNALDACSKVENGCVTIGTEYDASAGQVRVSISDNGVGIPPEDIDQIFALFVSRKKSRGTGLGLPVSQKIVNEHGGQILVTSEPGKGSRFTLQLPAVPAEEMQHTDVPS